MAVVPCPQSLAQVLAEVVTLAGAIVLAVMVPPTVPLAIPAIIADVVALMPVVAWLVNYVTVLLETQGLPKVIATSDACTSASTTQCFANNLLGTVSRLDALGGRTCSCVLLARNALNNAGSAITQAATFLRLQGRLPELDAILALKGF